MQSQNKFYMPGEGPEEVESFRFFVGLRMSKSMFLDLEKEANNLGISLSEIIRKKIDGS